MTRTSGEDRRSGRITKRWVAAPIAAENRTPTTADGRNAQPAFDVQLPLTNTPAMPMAPMREVQDARAAVDDDQALRGERVQRADAEAEEREPNDLFHVVCSSESLV